MGGLRSYCVLCVCLLPGILSGCSVKEAREECPKFINMNFQEGEEALMNGRVSVLGWNGGVLFRDEIDASEIGSYWVRAVQEGVFDISLCAGVSRSLSSGRYIEVPSGFQSDSLYAFYTHVDTRQTDDIQDVVFHKQFCTVHLDISRSAEEMEDFKFLVRGNTCGFDLFSFAPVEGEYVYSPVVVPGEEKVDFRILRQVDDSMSLEIWRMMEISEGTKAGGREYVGVGAFPLGRLISRTGYRWDGQDLEDVYVKFGFALEYVQISVEGWEEGTVFSFIEQ